MTLRAGDDRASGRERMPTAGSKVRWPRWMRSWILVATVVSGLLSLLWLLLRAGPKPSRLAYPCQQAALGTATAAVGVPVAAGLSSLCRPVRKALRTVSGKLAAGGLGASLLTLWVIASVEPEVSVTMLTPRADYHPDVFLVDDARGIEPGRYGGVDDLITLMGTNGLEWHRSTATTLTSGPDGLIDAAAVVILKVNAQWPQRGGTNTDVLRGVIRRIVEHPDGFAGEIVVADNSQEFGDWPGNLDRDESNAEDHSQSAQDVVNDFVAEGWDVSTRLWDGIRRTAADEYDTGDMADGYIVSDTLDPQTAIRVSYPKFQTAFGRYISYRYGVWSAGTQTYDSDKLVVINIPVFKTHAIYAVTASVKNHVGLVTTSLATDSHSAVGRGGMGSVLADVRRPDLTILDCIWVLARPGSGPSAGYTIASRRDQLVASVDPIALDAWATKFILIPQIIENGYDYSTYHNTQDPDNPDSVFRRYLDLSMNELLSAGIDATNDYNAVSLHTWAGSEGPAAPLPESFQTDKNRFLTFIGTNPGEQTALRVTFSDLPAGFESWNGTIMWVGAPREICENAGQNSVPVDECGPAPGLPSRTFTTAPLVCEAHYTDWSAEGTVHVYAPWIIPGGSYHIQAIQEDDDPSAEENYSASLITRTGIWGDVVSDCTTSPCGPPNGAVDITTDVTSVLDKFKNLPGAPLKARCDLEPELVDHLVNITDVTYCLGAFLGDTYPAPGFPPPRDPPVCGP